MKQIDKRTIPPLSVGYSVTADGQFPFTDIVKRYRGNIGEVYFAFPGISGGRSVFGSENGYTDHTALDRLTDDLTEIKSLGISLDLLLNSVCDGDDALSLAHERRIVSVLDYLYDKQLAPKTVTTASPITAKIVREYDKSIDVRASVNMRITTLKGIKYVEHLFDSFCIGKDLNRSIDDLKECADYLHAGGKRLTVLANSGCLRSCSMQTFHDNAVAHESGIMTRSNLPWASVGGCHAYLSHPENRVAFLQNTWIRPEDVHNYLGIADYIKLATRVHSFPFLVIDAYAKGVFHGNLPDLFEPGHGQTFAPYVINNDLFPADWFSKTASCSKKCEKCTYCDKVLEKVLVNSEH